MAQTVYRVFVDESGVRAHGPKTSRHFTMSACILPDACQSELLATMADLRTRLGRPPDTTIAFKNLSHQARLHVVQTLAGVPYLTISSVIVCKRELAAPMRDLDGAYLYTLRYLLERISWFVDDHGGRAYVTFAHIDRFKISKLHEYVAHLQAQGRSGTEIRWPALNLPVRMETMQGNDFLQLADATASATGQAFEPDQFGNVERRYIEVLAPRLYRRPPGAITSYGMKLHPTSMVRHPDYGWLATL